MVSKFKRAGRPEAAINLCFPWISRIFPTFLEKNKTLETIQDMMNLMLEHIRQHQETLDINEPRDLIDKYLIKIDNTADEKSSFYKSKGIENLQSTLLDLFMAGSETTSTALTWSVLYMVRYPDIQRKVQEEIDRTVGTNRQPCMDDRDSLPYTQV